MGSMDAEVLVCETETDFPIPCINLLKSTVRSPLESSPTTVHSHLSICDSVSYASLWGVTM